MTIEVIIHTNCFPLLQLKSNIDAGSEECTEAYMFVHPTSTSIR